MKIITVYGINLNWLLVGEGEPFIGGKTEEIQVTPRVEAKVVDPVVQLLYGEEKRAGITLIPEQRTAILKILRELVERDVRSIRELLRSMQRGQKIGYE